MAAAALKCCPPALKLFLFNYIATPDARPDVPLDVVRCKLNSCVHTERAQVPEGPCNNDVLCTAPGPRECVCVCECECAYVCVCELVMKPKPKWVSVSCSMPRPAPHYCIRRSTRPGTAAIFLCTASATCMCYCAYVMLASCTAHTVSIVADCAFIAVKIKCN